MTKAERLWENYSRKLVHALTIKPDLMERVHVSPLDVHPKYAREFAHLKQLHLKGLLTPSYALTRYSADELELLDVEGAEKVLDIFPAVAARGKVARALSEAYRGINERPLMDTVKELETLFRSLENTNGNGAVKGHNIDDLIDETLDRVERIKAGEALFVPSPYASLNRLIGGFWPGNLYIIAGRPGIGKTAFAVNILVKLAELEPVWFLTCEMTPQELGMRVLSLVSGVSYFHIRTGRLDSFESQALQRAKARIPANMTIVETSGQDVESIAGTIASAARAGCRVVVLDYLQRIPYPRGLDSMDLAMGYICKTLKNVSLRHNVALVVMAQLNRQVEQTSTRRPELHHLRESGNIEQEADLVAFLYREAYYKEVADGVPQSLEFIVRKNRHGPVGTVTFTFYPKTMGIKEEEEKT